VQQKLAGFQPCVLLKGCREVRDGGVAQHDGYLRDAKPLFIEQVAGVFHPLALVKIEDGRAEHLFEPFFQIAFIDRHLPAQFLDGQGLADVLKQDLAGLDDLFAIGFVCEELALEAFDLFLPNHAFQAVEKEHLALGVDIDIFVAAGIAMVEQGLEDQPGPAAEGEGLAKRGGVPELEQVFADGRIRSSRLRELREMDGQEAEAEDVDGIDPFGAARGGV